VCGGLGQYITLAFIGCISLSSLRSFLRNMRKARRPPCDFSATLFKSMITRPLHVLQH
jgi:hypothetical protein